MTDDGTGPWVRGASSGGGSQRAYHTARDCWRLERAHRVREATAAEVEELAECGGADCSGRNDAPGRGEGHLASLREAADRQTTEQEDA